MRPLRKLSRRLKGYSHQQSLRRLRDAFAFTPRAVYDIGAHHGKWTASARRVFPQARYFLFEANPDNAPILDATGERHFIGALAARDGEEREFFLSRNAPSTTGSSLYREQSAHYRGENLRRITVTTRRLDSLVAEHGLPPPDLIKLDVQGAELAVLAGAGAAVEGCAAIIAELSFLRMNEGAPLAAEVIAEIDRLNFKCVDVCKIHRTRVDSVLQLDILFANAALYDRVRTAAGLT